jgi:hypothetical protein
MEGRPVRVTETSPGVYEIAITHLNEQRMTRVLDDLRMASNIDALRSGRAYSGNVIATHAIELERQRLERELR